MCDPSAELCLCWIDEWNSGSWVIPLPLLLPSTLCLLVFSLTFSFDLRIPTTLKVLSAPTWWGKAFIFPLNATWEAGGEGLQPANGDAVSGLETSSPHQCLSAPCCLSSFLYSCKACLVTHCNTQPRPLLTQ